MWWQFSQILWVHDHYRLLEVLGKAPGRYTLLYGAVNTTGKTFDSMELAVEHASHLFWL